VVTFQERFPLIRYSGGFFTAVTYLGGQGNTAYSTSVDGEIWKKADLDEGLVAFAFQPNAPTYRFAVDSTFGNLWMQSSQDS